MWEQNKNAPLGQLQIPEQIAQLQLIVQGNHPLRRPVRFRLIRAKIPLPSRFAGDKLPPVDHEGRGLEAIWEYGFTGNYSGQGHEV